MTDRAHRIIAYLLVVAAFAGCLWLIDNEANQRASFDDRRAYDICISQAEGRTVLREFVTYVLEQPQGADLSFVQTTDPEIQSVLDQITARSTEPATDAEIEATLERIPLPDCESLRGSG